MGRLNRDRKTVRIGGGETRQTETIIGGIVIAAALLVGFFVIDSLADSTPATETTTVDNESVGTVTFTGDTFFYTVSANDTDAEEGFLDNEEVYNATAQLTEATDYEWFPANGTVRIDNTTAVDNSSTNVTITYTYNSHMDGFEETLNRIGDAMLIGGVIIIVLFAAIILRVLRGL